MWCSSCCQGMQESHSSLLWLRPSLPLWPCPHSQSGLGHLISPSISGSPRVASRYQGALGLELCVQLCSDMVCISQLWDTVCSPALGSVHWLLSTCPRLDSLLWDQRDLPRLSWWRGQEQSDQCLDTADGSFGVENGQFSDKMDKEVSKVGIGPKMKGRPVRDSQGVQNLRMPRAGRL